MRPKGALTALEFLALPVGTIVYKIYSDGELRKVSLISKPTSGRTETNPKSSEIDFSDWFRYPKDDYYLMVDGAPRQFGYLFSNYFLAYGYSLTLRKVEYDKQKSHKALP